MNPRFSIEPASKTWYTRLDDKNRLLGSHMFRHSILKAYSISILHVPYYEWQLCVRIRVFSLFNCFTISKKHSLRSQTDYLVQQARLQLGRTSFAINRSADLMNIFNIDIHGRMAGFVHKNSSLVV